MSNDYVEQKVVKVNEFVTVRIMTDVKGRVLYNIYNSISHSDISLYDTTFKKLYSLLNKVNNKPSPKGSPLKRKTK